MMRIKCIIIIIFLFISLNLYSQTWTYYTNDWQFAYGAGGGQGNPIIADYYGNLWFAPYTGLAGLWKYDVGLDQWISFSNIFSNKMIRSMYADAEDSYWVSIANDFIYHFDGNNIIRHYTTAGPYWDFIPNKDYSDILVDGNEHVIVVCQRTASLNGFLDYYPVDTAPNQTWNHHCIMCPNSEDLINVAMESNGQVLWFNDRLGGINRTVITNYDPPYWMLLASWSAYIAIDFYNTKYVAVLQNANWPGVGCIALSNNNNYSTIPIALTTANPFHVMIDNDNRKCFSSSDGAAIFNGTNWVYYSTNNGLANNLVRAMVQTMDGDYWFIHDNRISRLRLPEREGFQLQSFNNASGDNNGVSDYMTINGTGFRQGVKVKLKRDGQSDIWATEVQVVDAHTIK